MKTIVNSVSLRLFITAALIITLVGSPQLRVSSANTTFLVQGETESQLKSEAATYDSAIQAIGGISTMSLATPDDLKKATAIVDRARPGLGLFRSKLVILALRDSTFSSAVKKTAANASAAEAFLKELNADPTSIAKLAGVDTLEKQLQESIAADAAKLRQAGEHLSAAAAKIKQASRREPTRRFEAQDQFKMIRVSADMSNLAVGVGAAFQVDPVTLLLIIAVTAAVIVVTIFAITAIKNLYNNLFSKLGRDRVAACRKDADDRLAACLAAANKLPFPFNVSAIAECEGQWLVAQGECLLTTN